MALAVPEPVIDDPVMVEAPIAVDEPLFPEDIPALLGDPPALAPVVLSPGHVAAVGSLTLALIDLALSNSTFAVTNGTRWWYGSRGIGVLTYRILAERPG